MEINTQQPRGTDCYSHFVQTSRDGPGDGSAGHHLCPSGDSLATAWALLLSAGTGMGTGCICPSPVGVPKEQCVTKCWLNPHWRVPLVFQKLVGIEGQGQERRGLCQGENHPGCVHTHPHHTPVQTRGAWAVSAATCSVTSELGKGKHMA